MLNAFMIFHRKLLPLLLLSICQTFFSFSYAAITDLRNEKEKICEPAERHISIRNSHYLSQKDGIKNQHINTYVSSGNNIRVNPGTEFTIPIYLEQKNPIYGIDMTLLFDDQVIAINNVSLSGGILDNEGYELNTGSKINGQFSFGLFAGRNALSKSGMIANINCQAIGELEDQSFISIQTYDCNELPVSNAFHFDDQTFDTVQLTIADIVPPFITITEPVSGISVEDFLYFKGTVADNLSKISKIEIQISCVLSGETFYIDNDNYKNTECWNDATFTNQSWQYNAVNISFRDNTWYTVHVRAWDAYENTSTITSTFGINIEHPSTLTCHLSQERIILGESIKVSGTVASESYSLSKVIGQLNVSFISSSPMIHKIIHTEGVEIPGDYSFDIDCSDIPNSGLWTVKAILETVDGRIKGAESLPQKLTVNQANVCLAFGTKTSAVKIGQAVTLSGSFIPEPECRSDLSGHQIVLSIAGPDSTSYNPIITTQRDGTFEFKDYNELNKLGKWTIKAIFLGNSAYKEKQSESLDIYVTESPGYAIIVQGRNATQEGLASHYKTTSFVYSILKNRGLFDEDILFFTYHTPSGQETFNHRYPDKNDIKNSIISWAGSKMNEKPANLNIIMVDHGLSDEFLISPESISSSELDGWIDDLQDKTLIGDAKKQEIVIILGFCYSGSYIDNLSGNNRIIISSASKTEKSFKGEAGIDGILEGEFFVAEYFRQVNLGKSIHHCFNSAARQTEIFSYSGRLKSPTQHPQIDDNGDGISSNQTSLFSNDGQYSENVFIGTSSISTNQPLESIVNVTSDMFLEMTETNANFWASVENKSQIRSIWIEIKRPDYSPEEPEDSSQREMNLNQIEGTYNDKTNRFEWDIDDAFDISGLYQIFYFVIDHATGQMSSFKDSRVYKNQTGNSSPNAFCIYSPENAALVFPQKIGDRFYIIFDWEDTLDPDGNFFNYALYLSRSDSSFRHPTIIKDIRESTLFLDLTDDMPINFKYYWKIQAIDEYGAIQESEIREFDLKSPNQEEFGLIKGCVYNYGTDIKLTHVNVTSNSRESHFVMPNQSCYLGTIPFSTHLISASAEGYQSDQVQIYIDKSWPPEEKNFNLFPKGDLNQNGLIDLKDIIKSLQILSDFFAKQTSDEISYEADINDDKKIGLVDLLYMIRVISQE